jgi:exosortase A-associated hydrolase 1
MNTIEHPVCFQCHGETLIGILHRAATPSDTGIVIVVGGPQYRIGSHRHFVELARDLANNGLPVLRFDVRGMGDSSGTFPGFDAIDDDIAAATNVFIREEPHIKNLILWGLCDGASASIFYAPRDRRVTGLILLNPWIRSEATYARTELRHYYGAKILDGAFWRRLISGNVDLRDALRSLFGRIRAASASTASSAVDSQHSDIIDPTRPLSERMAKGLAAFKGRILLIISGNDLTAKEFDDVTRGSDDWVRILSADRVQRRDLENADHTFSQAEWSTAVNNWTLAWAKGSSEPASSNEDQLVGIDGLHTDLLYRARAVQSPE